MLKYQTIAPAPQQKPASASHHGSVGLVCKTRKYAPRTAAVLPYNVDQTQSVQRRNARERNRVKQVNNSFARLRQHIPQSIITDLTKGGGRGPHKKVSKVDTLRIAVEYIRRLQDLVDDLNGDEGASRSSIAQQTLSAATMAALNDTSSNCSFISTASSGSSSSNSNGSAASNGNSLSPVTGTGASFYGAAVTSMATGTYQRMGETPLLPTMQQQPLHFPPSGLLTPVSLHSYSPPRLPQLEGGMAASTVCHSPNSTAFNSSVMSASYDSANFDLQVAAGSPLSPPLPPLHQEQHQQGNAGADHAHHLAAQLQLKFEPYDNFHLAEDDCTPDDEEILDYISLWEEQ